MWDVKPADRHQYRATCTVVHHPSPVLQYWCPHWGKWERWLWQQCVHPDPLCRQSFCGPPSAVLDQPGRTRVRTGLTTVLAWCTIMPPGPSKSKAGGVFSFCFAEGKGETSGSQVRTPWQGMTRKLLPVTKLWYRLRIVLLVDWMSALLRGRFL